MNEPFEWSDEEAQAILLATVRGCMQTKRGHATEEDIELGFAWAHKQRVSRALLQAVLMGEIAIAPRDDGDATYFAWPPAPPSPDETGE